MSYKGSNGNFDAALIQLIRKLSDASNYFSGEHSEVRKFARSLLRDWDHTRGTDWYTITKKEEDAMSQTVPLHTSDSDRTLVEALEHIREYWNRDQNEHAMADALWHIIETADEALSCKGVNDDECAMVAQVEHERKLFEARMRRVAPGVNLEMIGDRYNDLDTQWKFELWLDRAALASREVVGGI